MSNNDKLEFTKSDLKFIKCAGDNLSLGIKNFNLDYNKIFSDLSNIDNKIPSSKLEYKQTVSSYLQSFMLHLAYGKE